MLAKRKLETSLKDEGDKTKLKNKLKKVTNEVTSEEIDDLDDENSGDEKISKDDIDYNMPKPGPHAKRAIRQEREERRLIRTQQKDKQELEEETAKGINGTKHCGGKSYSLSIAIPGSIMTKIQSKELKTYFCGQIARAACLFCVDEIIIYNEFTIENKIQTENNEQLIKILEYLECPQYLRKALFPPNKYLEHVGLLTPLEAPHHFKLNDEWIYREGVTTDIPSKLNKGAWVDIGLLSKIEIDKKLEPGIRVTVKNYESSSKKLRGIVVSPETPRTESGLYWGYQVRYAASFRKILSESSFKENYDMKIGVNLTNKLNFESLKTVRNPRRVLVVFGGTSGIEAAIEADEKLKANNMDDIFDFVCEGNEVAFGSRSIRLEEALLISLSMIRSQLLEYLDDVKNNDPVHTEKN